MERKTQELQQNEEEQVYPEWKDLISTLPKQATWFRDLYRYQGFWFSLRHLQPLLAGQKHFVPRHSDVFIVTYPKSGTTWLKAIVFTLLNRAQHPPAERGDHPLSRSNPHSLVPFLEMDLYGGNRIPDMAAFDSPSVFATHSPYVCLPESVKNDDSCKIVYLCRNPKDVFVSYWHFGNKLKTGKDQGNIKMSDHVAAFCDGMSGYGPLWDHTLGFWNESKKNPRKVLFLKFEDMKEEPEFHLRRLADFLECPFSEEEEGMGMVEKILEMCSFQNLSSLDVNKVGELSRGVKNKVFFRRGEVGDWRNHLSDEMAERFDQVSEMKFAGSGLVL